MYVGEGGYRRFGFAALNVADHVPDDGVSMWRERCRSFKRFLAALLNAVLAEITVTQPEERLHIRQRPRL